MRSLSAVGQDEARSRPPLIERVRARQQRHRQRNRLFRVAFAIAGFLVLLAGVVMLFTPGPGLAAIVLGLTMLALEFAWAERLLDRALDQADVAQRKAAETTRTQRILGAVAAALAAAVAVTVWLLWEIPLIPG
jgi:uncharacterized protein (TIGR02611 family)